MQRVVFDANRIEHCVPVRGVCVCANSLHVTCCISSCVQVECDFPNGSCNVHVNKPLPHSTTPTHLTTIPNQHHAPDVDAVVNLHNEAGLVRGRDGAADEDGKGREPGLPGAPRELHDEEVGEEEPLDEQVHPLPQRRLRELQNTTRMI